MILLLALFPNPALSKEIRDTGINNRRFTYEKAKVEASENWSVAEQG